MKGRFDTNRGVDGGGYGCLLLCHFSQQRKVPCGLSIVDSCIISFTVYCCFLLPSSLDKWFIEYISLAKF
jgi:hypothetical protein